MSETMEAYIHLSKYAKWNEVEKRRETWPETVRRYVDYFGSATGQDLEFLYEPILNKDVMPSMRAMMTAGAALKRCNTVAYNCAAIAVDSPRVFDEHFYLLMGGSGVGFSVERQYINKLPVVADEMHNTDTLIVVQDSRTGWAKAFKELIALLYNGDVPRWDVSRVRPAGARLKIMGGRACLTGDTIVYRDRKKSKGYNEVTIDELVKLKKESTYRFNLTKLRSLDESDGTFYRNSLLDVIDNGVSEVFLVTTESGYTIKATSNHRFMDATGGYIHLSEFKSGDLIAVNGSSESKTGVCLDCGCAVSRRAVRCLPCQTEYQLKGDALENTARQRKQCRDYSLSVSGCERCGAEDVRLIVHHKDLTPHNNDWDNLEVLCETCHQRHHASLRTHGDPYSHKYMSYDKIVSIVSVGEERVYDLSMEAPDHNFVANGFVSHNSGPVPLVTLFKYTIKMFRGAAGRKLNSEECHRLMCKVAQTVIVGSVRRSACISFGNLTDDRHRRLKTGEFWLQSPELFLSNNSVMYTEKPDLISFTKEMRSIYRSKAGERGIVNQEALQQKADDSGREHDGNYLLNP